MTAALLALCLPPLAPWWLIVSGTAFAILLAKHLYGGLGANPFNPAMVGYAVLLVSFPAQLLQWLPPDAAGLERADLTLLQTLTTIFTGTPPAQFTWDAITSPTPLDALRTNLTMGMTMSEARASPIFGGLGGQGWQWINFAALAGGVWLLVMRIIRWHIPVAMLGAIALCASIMYLVDPGAHAGPIFHLTFRRQHARRILHRNRSGLRRDQRSRQTGLRRGHRVSDVRHSYMGRLSGRRRVRGAVDEHAACR